MMHRRVERCCSRLATAVLPALFLVVVLILPCGCATQRRVIENPEIDDWDTQRMMYKNLFPSTYGYMEESKYDRIDFRQPHEKAVRKKYAFVSDPRGDIDRTKGYDPKNYTVTPNLSRIRSPDADIQITWIRHASFLIQIDGRYQILVDPVLEELDGLLGVFGKYADIGTLYADVPLATQDLPFAAATENQKTDDVLIVAISHDHYDHLNYNTLDKLPEKTVYYVPHGLERDFPNRFTHVVGMDWYTSDTISDLTITFLPANHRSGRSMHESNQTLWGGWLFEWKGRRVYFAGDTGYSAVFRDIRSRTGDMDVCLMPITAWFQRHWHFAPEDAIVAAEDLGCKIFAPWAWGTWIMSFEHILEPPRRLEYAWDDMQPQNMELHILKMGEMLTVDR